MIYDLITLKTNPEKWSYNNLKLSFTFSLGLSFGKSVIAQLFIYCRLYMRQWFWGIAINLRSV